MRNPFENNKLEILSGARLITDTTLAIEILKSDAFDVIDFSGYLAELQKIVGHDYSGLISFISCSPFFNEGPQHQQLKRLISQVFTKSNIDHWRLFFKQEIAKLNSIIQDEPSVDLVGYCFDISKKLLRPLLLGIEEGLPDDFEIRLYDFQKLVEPMLSIKQLARLEGELNYLYQSLEMAHEKQKTLLKNSFPQIINTTREPDLTTKESLMLMLVVYGAKTPLIQTLGNIFLQILNEQKNRIVFSEVTSDKEITAHLDAILYDSAALLYIHRVANRSYSNGSFSVEAGENLLIRTRSPESQACGRAQALGFGVRTHYCSGTFIAKTIISMVVPTFFNTFPNAELITFEYDPTIHTAKALTSLKVNLQ